ncbi:MAG: protein phosphatase 2C domain-containing protein [Candidatus Cloacimonadaceae bacterium]|nr:protein phosphatase 2C domain-containing protein [Candidatus Cloacimonadaceae bacterium]
MAKITAHISVGALSDIGLNPARTKNEDYYGRFDGDYGTLFIVCDGMGGHEGGEIASRIAVESIKSYFDDYFVPTEEIPIIVQSIDHAHQNILATASRDIAMLDMGSTLVLLLIKGSQFWYAHSGDSRIYMRRGDSINRLTKDHSEVQGLVDTGVISPEQAKEHPRRNVISKALGHTNYTPDVSGPHVLYQDDVFLLCTDGLTEYVADEEIMEYMSEDPQISCQILIELAKQRGGADNITAQMIRVVHGAVEGGMSVAPKKASVNFKKYGISAFFALTAIFILWQIRKEIVDRGARDEKPEIVVSGDRVIPEVISPKEKKKEPKAEEQPAPTTQPVSVAGLEAQLEKELSVVPAGAAYTEFLAKLNQANPSAGLPTQLKFIREPKEKRSIFVVPGKTIYIAFRHLANVEKVPGDQFFALISIAAAIGISYSGGLQDYDQLYFAGATGAIPDNVYGKATELYIKTTGADKFRFARNISTLKPRLKQANLALHYVAQ